MKKRFVEEEKYLTEKDKYYTPTLDEFCLGFEYEQTEGHLGQDWGRRKVRIGDNHFYSFDMTHVPGNTIWTVPKTIRVKYLDKEDIESLGFKDISLCDGQEFIKDNITIKYYNWSWDSPKGLIMIRVIEDGVSFYNFSGHLKNKSELKRLLKQLDIEESNN